MHYVICVNEWRSLAFKICAMTLSLQAWLHWQFPFHSSGVAFILTFMDKKSLAPEATPFIRYQENLLNGMWALFFTLLESFKKDFRCFST